MVTGLVAGGVGRHVEQLTRSLVGLGHEVSVATPSVVAARFGLGEVATRVIPLEIGNRPAPHRDRRTVAALREAFQDIDVVHAHGLRAGALSVLARDGAGAPALVVTTHNAAPEGRLAAVVHRGLDRVVCRGADLVLGVSADLAEAAQERGAKDVGLAVVPASGTRQPSRDRDEVLAELGVDGGTQLLVAVGRLSPQKGFDRLLDAIEAADLGESALVVIAGDGPQAQALERRIDRAALPVQLLGHRDDVPDLIGAADLCISAARWEGQPVWLQEALALGAPVVATDVGGTSQVLDGAAVLVPGDDPEALAAALTGVLADPELRAELRRKALDRAGELPSADDAAQAALTAYRRAVSVGADRAVD